MTDILIQCTFSRIPVRYDVVCFHDARISCNCDPAVAHCANFRLHRSDSGASHLLYAHVAANNIFPCCSGKLQSDPDFDGVLVCNVECSMQHLTQTKDVIVLHPSFSQV